MKKYFFIFIFAVTLTGSVYSADVVGGGTFLRMGAGARAGALSGAFTAYDDDATVPYWNPSAAAMLEKTCISSMFAFLPADFKYSFFNAVFGTEYGHFGANVINLSSGEIEGRSGDTEDFYTFEHTETAIFLTYAKKITPWFSAGANIKVININSYQSGAGGFSLDSGFLISPNNMLSFGLTLRDMYGEISWTTGTKEKIPYYMRLGALGKLFNDTLRLSLDIEKLEFDEGAVRAGAEYGIFGAIFLRAGVSYGFSSYDFNYTLGGGFKYEIGKITLQMDYAFFTYEFSGPQQVIDTNHKISLAGYF